MTPKEINEAVALNLGFDPTSFVPNYCESIGAAWAVCDAIAQMGLHYSIGDNGGAGAFIQVEGEQNGQKVMVIETADTAPMAICKAFIQLAENLRLRYKSPTDLLKRADL